MFRFVKPNKIVKILHKFSFSLMQYENLEDDQKIHIYQGAETGKFQLFS